MWHLLKRHPIPMRASFDFVLSITYAFPSQILSKLVPPGLRLDEWEGRSFLAAAFVQTRHMRPAVLPRFAGARYFFSGYRVFCRFKTRGGRELRGLRILRSDTDKGLMVTAGNLLTYYNYHLAQIDVRRAENSLRLRVTSHDGNGDVDVTADLAGPLDFIPEGSPFLTARDARHFAGPMPFTFDYESETNSIIRIQGLRKKWRPRLIPVSIKKLTFLAQEKFADASPIFASCFYMEGVDYRWKRGVRERLAVG
jgi:uncharacterized protein YqjF (DUF2071 family)